MKRSRVIIYSSLIAALVALNVYSEVRDPDDTPQPAVQAQQTNAFGRGLELTLLAAPIPPANRDIFRAVETRQVPKPVVAKPAVAERPRQDPIEFAIGKARQEIENLKLIGVLDSEVSALAVIEHEGNTVSRSVGQEVLPGFRLEKVSQGSIQLRHDQLGFAAIISLGGREPLQVIRVE